MIEIYKTNVATKNQSEVIIGMLKKTFSSAHINFDLEDADKILRIRAIAHFDTKKVIKDLARLGFKCVILN